MLKNLIFSGVLSLLVVACASSPKIDTLRAPDVDFSGYSSFAFVDPLGTDRGGYASLISQQLKFSIRRELEILGFEYVDDAEQADLLVNAYTHLDERIRSRQVSEPYVGPAYWNYRAGFYSTWPGYSATRTELQKYTEGSLTIDLIDYTDKVMVWEGTARNEITETTRRDAARAIDQAVARIFEQFP